MDGLENIKHVGIEDIEKELIEVMNSEIKNWVRIYQLTSFVEAAELFKPDFRSFTQWVNHLSSKTNYHVSSIWKAKKEGRFYAGFERRCEEKGIEIPSIEKVQISVDSLELIEKIAGNNTDEADDLIIRTLDGKLSRADLRNAWATVKAERADRKEKRQTQEAFREEEFERESQEETPRTITSEVLKAADIIYGLMHADWLPEIYIPENKIREVPMKYRMFSEFPVVTGSSRHARRIDALVVENYSVPELRDKAYEVALHGIEIKVDKYDLIKDHKMNEYTDFVDYFWIAVPGDLVEQVEELALKSWGILAADEPNNLQVVRAATKLSAVKRETTLATVVLQSL